ncbi:uncharacterized protein PAC_13620 [Phialocephala subalpina]|uniref:Uncharacterized protein n=1 Tax=Phialocephala subalpina TaxID=576137 RepID=A0A1L7XFB6_9HELO|nr:uncharacterized protein PAC_13620 [Phialocephala subalpina]
MVHFKSLLLLLPVATGLNIQKRFQFGQLILDAVTIDNNIKTLTYAVGNWTEAQTIFGAIPILTDSNTLGGSINTGASNAQQSPPLTDDQAANIAALVEDYITPDTATLLAAMKAKKQDFTDVGALGTVQSQINTLRADQTSYSNALLAIIPASGQQQGLNDAAVVDGYFADAVAYFAS